MRCDHWALWGLAFLVLFELFVLMPLLRSMGII